jgi:hypothetical protein
MEGVMLIKVRHFELEGEERMQPFGQDMIPVNGQLSNIFLLARKKTRELCQKGDRFFYNHLIG